ncbi:hypothetical protein AAG570_003075 [Ranatra chinensis]|uniref:Peptidase S1 domain-containing protein n=1 Tax=Ranatra chinensis TaxID=642074 RepID=A0ABD0Y5Q3_9HEMI
MATSRNLSGPTYSEQGTTDHNVPYTHVPLTVHEVHVPYWAGLPPAYPVDLQHQIQPSFIVIHQLLPMIKSITIVVFEKDEEDYWCLGMHLGRHGACQPLTNCTLGSTHLCLVHRSDVRGECCAADGSDPREERAPQAPVPLPPVPPAIVSIAVNDVEEETENVEMYSRLGDPYVCGYNGKKATRIHGGQEAGVRDWPWMAVLLRSDDFFNYCGGVLLTRRHILTAAHCVHR